MGADFVRGGGPRGRALRCLDARRRRRAPRDQSPVALADGRTILTTPRGGEERDLGGGGCLGFSSDGRYLLLESQGGVRYFIVYDTTDGSKQEIFEHWDARFLP
jgi:hypothetical protein